MSIPLLKTKLYPPSPYARGGQSNQIPRTRLLERMRLDQAGPLILLSAPAGFGKSTLLGAWLAQLQISAVDTAWLALDAADNDATQFWRYVIAALQRVRSHVGAETLALFDAPQPPRASVAMTPLLNQLMAEPTPLVLVLDDYHFIQERAVHQAVTFLIEHLPPHVHVVISSRIDPPLPLARWRATGVMVELRAEHLRFTTDEAAAFLQQVMNLHIAADATAALTTRTEGWIAGLQLAALSLQQSATPEAFIAAFSGENRYIVDYLGEEVLNQQSPAVRDFLFKTSLLERFCGPLCDALLASAPSEVSPLSENLEQPVTAQAILEYLEHANLFLVPLDDERIWYRYHHLFADLLRNRLEQLASTEIPRLHGLASAWFEGAGLPVDAIRHALTAADYARAARLIEAVGLSQFAHASVQNALESWLALLPSTIVEERPRLALLRGWLLFNRMQTPAALGHLARAATLAGADQTLQAEIAAVRALTTAYQPDGDLSAAAAWGEEALGHLGANRPAFRSIAAAGLAWINLRRGALARAEQRWVEAAATGRAAGNIHLALAAMASLAVVQRSRGALNLALATCTDALAWLTEQNAQHVPPAAGLHITLADLHLERNDLVAAQRAGEQALALSDHGTLPMLHIVSRFALLRQRMAQGDLAAALHLRQELQIQTRQFGMMILQPALAGIEAQLQLAQADLAGAWHWARSAAWPENIAIDARQIFDFAYTLEHFRLVRAQVFVAYGRATRDDSLLAETIAHLERLIPVAEKADLRWLQIKAHLLKALAHQARRESAQAVVALSQAVALAAGQGFVRIFLDEGEPLRSLIAASRMTIRDVRVRTYLDNLFVPLEASTSPYPTPLHTPQPLVSDLIEPLSDREREVLALVADGLSNQEIANILIVALSTVKKHINNIFSKLDVTHRAQAVARARAAGLLE